MSSSPAIPVRFQPFRRVCATMITDFRLQSRNGFYHAVVFVVAVIALIVTRFPQLELNWLLPVLVLGNLPINTFYFIAGLVLLEKVEGTVDAQVVTPLRTREYLASKAVTLTVVSVIENGVLVVLLAKLNFYIAPLVAGIVLASVLCSMIGFALIARYDSINEYIFPSVFYNAMLILPMLDYLNLWRSWLFYLHPLQGSLLLLRAAFEPIPVWQWVYAAASGLAWVVVAWYICQRAFDRFILTREGAR